MAESSDQHLDEEPKALNSDYGWIIIMKLTNNSNRVVRFKNPHNNDNIVEIKPGKEGERNCIGNLPYTSSGKCYQISYVSEKLGKRVNIEITDMGGDWKASFKHNGTVQDGVKVEDVRVLEPTAPDSQHHNGFHFGAHIVINSDGYEVFEFHYKRTRAKIIYGSI